MTITELFSKWHRSILHRVKESTAANYTMKADKHILPAFGDMPVSTLTADSIYDFIAEKQKAGFSPRYIADIVILMKTIFKYAVRTYQIFSHLDGIVLPKRKSPEIQLLDEAEQKTLQQYIGTHQNRSTMGTALSIRQSPWICLPLIVTSFSLTATTERSIFSPASSKHMIRQICSQK